MLNVKNLTIAIEDRELIKDLSFSLNKGDKLAIIGEEGNGKSTLLKAIVEPKSIPYATVSGDINRSGIKIGYLEQISNTLWNDLPVTSFFLRESPEDEDDYSKYEEFDKLLNILSKLNISDEKLDFEQKFGTLSGGEKVKMQIVKAILQDPDVLILDEPTNDLDLSTLRWLEDFIKDSPRPVIYVSHDETLLENSANAILHIEQIKKKRVCKHTYEHIGYKDYVQKRSALLEKQEQVALKERSDYDKQMEKWNQIYNKVDHELNSISRKDPHGARLLKKKMKSIKAQEGRFERNKKEFTDIPSPEEAINLKLTGDSIPSSKTLVDIDIKELQVANKVLSRDLSFKIVGPEKVVIIGDNGVGKTTFIKHLYNKYKDQKHLSVGYMPQNYNDEFSKYNTVLDFIDDFCHSKEEITLARTYLGSLNFTQEETIGKIQSLSGGQKAKLFLLKLMVNNYNLIILDEPTRNLSPLSNPVIRKALVDYKGAILAISHDRKFIQEVSTKVYKLTNNGLKEIETLND